MGPGTTGGGRCGARGARTAGGIGTGRRVRAGLRARGVVRAGLGTGRRVRAGLRARGGVRAGLGTGRRVRPGRGARGGVRARLGTGRRIRAGLRAGRRVRPGLGINLGRSAEGMAGSVAGLDIPTVTSFGLEWTTGFIGSRGRGPI